MFSATINRRVRALSSIVFRNVFLLINIIIFIVVILLTTFGDTQEGLFLGLITLINTVIGCTQEIHSWLTLERLQLLTAQRVVRINADATETVLLTDELQLHDTIKLKLGDQVPCDSVLMSGHGFEVNEGLITGESTAFLKEPQDKILAGSIVTSGVGLLKVEKVFAKSRIALMTESVRKYSPVVSPIQHTLEQSIRYISYVLVLVIVAVVVRGHLLQESSVTVIKNIGALTSALLPQGVVVIVTLIFSYGAIYFYRRNIVLQQVNATEKIARIKHLCMDKTGTLTDAHLIIEETLVPQGIEPNYAKQSVLAYIRNTADSSQTMETIKKTVQGTYRGTKLADVIFSSARQFGAVQVKDEYGTRVIICGAPDIFLPYLAKSEERDWLQKHLDTEAKIGKRLLCFAQTDSSALPLDLASTKLAIVSVFVLNNNLREGVVEAVKFFQDRGVILRIISGDNPETVQAVARAAGVRGVEKVATGAEVETWSEADFLKKVLAHTLFARIKPEQKEKIIDVLKRDGFTAMIGDGANDALAIKKADLGIAMFDGAQATRQVASIVLIKNSFADLPAGVKLADTIIQNIEICSSIFFNQAFICFFFFCFLIVLGYDFPFTPLNITFINYFTVGLPGALIFYWILKPAHPEVVRHTQSFARRVFPFALISAIPQALVALFAFYGSIEYIKIHAPTSLVIMIFIIMGNIYFVYASSLYSGSATRVQKEQFAWLFLGEVISIFVLLQIPLVTAFYNLKAPSVQGLVELLPLILVYCALQYGLTRWFRLPVTVKMVEG